MPSAMLWAFLAERLFGFRVLSGLRAAQNAFSQEDRFRSRPLSVKKGFRKVRRLFGSPNKNNSSSYIAVRAVRTRYSMACTGYCPAAVSPVSIRLEAPSSTAL